MIVGPSHTFEQFAEAIDAAFARWDLSHLHEFELTDGRRIGYLERAELLPGTSGIASVENVCASVAEVLLVARSGD